MWVGEITERGYTYFQVTLRVSIFSPLPLLREDQARHEVNRTSPGRSPAEPGELSGRRPLDVQPRLGGTAEPPGSPSGAEAAEGSSSVARKANEMLQDLGRLKAEMQTLLQVRLHTAESVLTGRLQLLTSKLQL